MGCLLAFFFVFLIALTSKAGSQANTATQPGQANYKPKQKTKHSNTSLILVPPPPPAQPSLLDWSGFNNISDSIGYLTAGELATKLEHIRKQISNAKLQEKDSEVQLAESKDKASRFDSLFSEGVVSRKELESAKKEVTDMERSNEDAKSNVADLEIQEQAIVRQLNLRKRSSKSSSHHLHKNTKEQKN
jgi:hypothetical protein